MRIHRTTPLLLAGLGLAWAGSPQPPVRCPDKPCGSLVVIARAGPNSLMPPAGGVAGDYLIGDLVFIKLADLGLSMNTAGTEGFIPRLASAWRFENPTTLVFNLNPRARWHDDRPVTARDVVFTYDVYRDSAVNADARPVLADITEVTARDEHTVVMRFRRAYPEMFFDATYHVRIIPRHLMDTIPRTRLTQHPLGRAPIGAGPYRLVSWREGEGLELAADSAFFLGPPGIARLFWRLVPDLTTAMTQLMAGDADLIDYLGSPENADRVGAAPHLRIFEVPSTAYTFLDLNLWNPDDLSQGHPLFKDREVRRAIARAIDRRRIVQTAYGRYGRLPVGPMSYALPLGRDTSIAQLPYDPAGARKTLDSLGWRDTNGDGVLDKSGQRFEFAITYPTSSVPRRHAFTVIEQNLKAVGIVVTVKSVDFATGSRLNEERQFHAALTNWVDDPTPSSLRQTYTTAGIGGSNFRGYTNPAFDRLVEQAVGESNLARRNALWREALALLNNDAPSVWLAANVQFGAIHRRFQDVTFRPDNWTSTLWTWRVAPGQAIPRDLVR